LNDLELKVLEVKMIEFPNRGQYASQEYGSIEAQLTCVRIWIESPECPLDMLLH
jgi:hypothetical protein